MKMNIMLIISSSKQIFQFSSGSSFGRFCSPNLFSSNLNHRVRGTITQGKSHKCAKQIWMIIEATTSVKYTYAGTTHPAPTIARRFQKKK